MREEEDAERETKLTYIYVLRSRERLTHSKTRDVPILVSEPFTSTCSVLFCRAANFTAGYTARKGTALSTSRNCNRAIIKRVYARARARTRANYITVQQREQFSEGRTRENRERRALEIFVKSRGQIRDGRPPRGRVSFRRGNELSASDSPDSRRDASNLR